MRKPKVCIYGGTALPEPAPAFVSELAFTILNTSPSVIVTGGFLHFANSPNETSTDYAALRGAQKYAQLTGAPLSDCFEAWLPDPQRDRNRERGGVIRMSEQEHKITIRRMGQKSALGRRLSMVHDVDVVVTVGGKRHTNEVLEQALELNVPALPLAFALGDSQDFWDQYRNEVIKWFSLSPEDIKFLDDLKATKVAASLPETARKVADLIARAKIGRCLVLLPFDQEHDTLFNKFIEPAVESSMICDRLDHRPGSAPIRTSFVDAVDRASAVIADVTDVNPNVMYEIGYALAKGLKPLFYCQNTKVVERLPVYLRDLNISVISSDEDLALRIKTHLAEVRSEARHTAAAA